MNLIIDYTDCTDFFDYTDFLLLPRVFNSLFAWRKHPAFGR
jgi:hypothetical protein